MFGDEEEDSVQEINFDFLKEGHLPTGIKKLDEEQPNGFPKGSVIVVMGDERSMTNLFGLHAASTGRPTQYVTTLRPAYLVREEVERISPGKKERLQESLDINDFFRSTDDHVSGLKSILQRVEDEGNLVIESINEINWPDDASYQKTIRKISKEIRMSTEDGGLNGLAYIHLQKSKVSELQDVERQLLNLADIVLQVDSQKVGGDLEHDLKIFKMRGIERMPEQVFKLKFGDRIRIDSARDI